MRWILLSVLFLLTFLLSPLPARAGDHASIEELKLTPDAVLCNDMILECISANTNSESSHELMARFWVIRDRHHGKDPAWASKIFSIGISPHDPRDCGGLYNLCPSGK